MTPPARPSARTRSAPTARVRLDRGRARPVDGANEPRTRGRDVRDGRWREVEVGHHAREDGAAVRHVPLRGASPRALGWIGLGPAPDRTPLIDRRGGDKRGRGGAGGRGGGGPGGAGGAPAKKKKRPPRARGRGAGKRFGAAGRGGATRPPNGLVER